MPRPNPNIKPSTLFILTIINTNRKAQIINHRPIGPTYQAIRLLCPRKHRSRHLFFCNFSVVSEVSLFFSVFFALSSNLSSISELLSTRSVALIYGGLPELCPVTFKYYNHTDYQAHIYYSWFKIPFTSCFADPDKTWIPCFLRSNLVRSFLR